MATIIRGLSNVNPSVGHPNYLSVTATLTAAGPWEQVATHEVFTVTGLVRMRMWIECTTTLEDAADAARIQFGHSGATNAFIASTAAATAGATLISTGTQWCDTSPAAVDTYSAGVMDYVIKDNDVGFEVTGADFTAGVLVFHCVWEPLSSTGSVVAGPGTTL
jgi:hypothetical protein